MICNSLIASDTPIVLRVTPAVHLMVGITTQNSVMSVSKLGLWSPTTKHLQTTTLIGLEMGGWPMYVTGRHSGDPLLNPGPGPTKLFDFPNFP